MGMQKIKGHNKLPRGIAGSWLPFAEASTKHLNPQYARLNLFKVRACDVTVSQGRPKAGQPWALPTQPRWGVCIECVVVFVAR
jgi:hypothetical protein